MNLHEAQKIARIISYADNGCHQCVMSLVFMLQRDFPEFAWKAVELGLWYKVDIENRVIVEEVKKSLDKKPGVK